MSSISCKLCDGFQWFNFSKISFGVWGTDSALLQRDTAHYPLAQCKQCGHVQVNIDYTADLFEKLYFHSTQEAVMWHESLVNCNSPYIDMAKFAINNDSPNTVVDFGCGEGKLLASVGELLEDSRLFGIDFNDRFDQSEITYLAYDLNKLDSIPKKHWPDGIDLAMASHVLEHVINPVRFLSQIKQMLSKEGKLFIEVPDFSMRHSSENIGQSNLVNLQHIHYFTIESLTYAAEKAGLKVVSKKQLTTGYIPRLQVILQPESNTLSNDFSFQNNAADVITDYQHQCRNLRSKLAETLMSTLDTCKQVGVWGVGADFYNLINEHPKIANEIKDKRVILFDYSLKGKVLFEQDISCSSQIPSVDFNVFMTPQLAETRIKMSRLSQDWNNVIDIFDANGEQHAT